VTDQIAETPNPTLRTATPPADRPAAPFAPPAPSLWSTPSDAATQPIAAHPLLSLGITGHAPANPPLTAAGTAPTTPWSGGWPAAAYPDFTAPDTAGSAYGLISPTSGDDALTPGGFTGPTASAPPAGAPPPGWPAAAPSVIHSRGLIIAVVVLAVLLVGVVGFGAWWIFGRPPLNPAPEDPAAPPAGAAAPADTTLELVPVGQPGLTGATTYTVNSATTSSEPLTSGYRPNGVFVIVNITAVYTRDVSFAPPLTSLLFTLVDGHRNPHVPSPATFTHPGALVVEGLSKDKPVTFNLVFEVPFGALAGSTVSGGDPSYRAPSVTLDLGL
jgi:hypothetical protein